MPTVRLLAVVLFAVEGLIPAQIIDYHQHLYSPVAGPISIADWKGVTSDELIPLMNEAHISRAIVLSTAYSLANPHKPPVRNEREAVRKDNDWTSAQVAKHADRLIGFCSVNPLKSYAIEEINRCAKDPNLRIGLKLHFGNSDVDVDNPAHLGQLKRVFRAANRNRMAILVHAHANVNFNRPYGSHEARVFLEQLLPKAPDVVVVLAHMAGAGGFDEATQHASAVYAEAIARHDPRVRNLYFDACISAKAPEALLLAQRIREVGVSRVFYGSDAPVKDNLPLDALARWHALPLSAMSSAPSKQTSRRFLGSPRPKITEGRRAVYVRSHRTPSRVERLEAESKIPLLTRLIAELLRADPGSLKQTSFIIHYLGLQAARVLGQALYEWPTVRSERANATFKTLL